VKRTDGHAAGEEALFDTARGRSSWGSRGSRCSPSRPRTAAAPRRGALPDALQREPAAAPARRDARAPGEGRFIGRRGGRVPGRLRRRIEETEELTRANRRLTLSFAFNYGGRAEIVDAARSLALEVARGRLDPERIDEKSLARRLYSPDMPDPDLVVRTSGEYRLSNFLLWEGAYSELVFTDVLWPDFRRDDLFDAVRLYQGRRRRFGGLDA